MTNTVKMECRAYCDNYGTGNYTEDKSKRYTLNLTKEKAEQYAELWSKAAFAHYETSKAYFYEVHDDARHYIQFILYK